MIRVYIATKLHYAQRIQSLRKEWLSEGIDIHARWHNQAHLESAEYNMTPNDFAVFWLVDEEDVKTADAVIVYGEPGDNLRGALVEAGMAIGSNILTIVCGENDNFGTWQHHPRVLKAATLEYAKRLILRRFHKENYAQ